MVSSGILTGGGLFGNERLLWPRRKSKQKAGWLVNTDGWNAPHQNAEEIADPLAEQTERTRSLWIASAATAVSWLGSHLLFPPLHLVSIPLTLAAALPLFQKAVTSVRNRQADISQVGSLGVIGGVFLPQTTGAALIPSLYFAGQTAIEKWQNPISNADKTAIDASLLADSDIQIVHCWQEESGDAQPVMRFVLESPDGSTRQGFTQLSDLFEALRGKVTAPQTAATPTVISGR